MARAMPREGIQGDEWTAYLTLGRTTRTYHGIAYRARAPGRRRANSSRRSTAPPGSPGKPGAGGSGSGDLDSSDKLLAGVVSLLLNAYYAAQFSDWSHGFRPGSGCHNALSEVVEVWNGTH